MSSTQPNNNPNIDLVNEACRERFELAWMTGERQAIEECLPESNSDEYEPTLEELICIQMELQWKAAAKAKSSSTIAVTAETVMSLPTSVEEFVARFPILGAAERQARLIRQEFLIRKRVGDQPDHRDYRHRFPNIDIESLLSADELCTIDGLYETVDGDSETNRSSPVTIEGYDLIEQIGSGGMGVVFRARQQAADREVALKLIRADRLQQVSEASRNDILDRFRVEAQATARLDHSNVVGIFEVNTNDPKMPWFSMQLVEGQSLSERLKSGPISNRLAAKFTLQIASAISAAHAQNVLHRDLKPQNVFLRSDGEHVLVGDFGLAKFALDDAGRTSHEDILGTPAYMSPEQIRDSSTVGPKTDIWSIGATLYHLLTGRPPFQAASAMETLRHVLDHEPTPPRSLNPSIDRDLETICLKCLQKDQKQRYSSASELHEDLSLFLEGRAIKARPVGRMEHVSRWCRRNPLAAVLAGLTTVGLLTAVISLWIGYQTAANALADSDQSHRMARQTVHDLLTEVSETVLLDKPGMQPLRRQLYERALTYYRKFIAAGRNSTSLEAESGDVWYRIGRLEKELGNPDSAADAFRRALDIQQKLSEFDPSQEHQTALSSTWNALGGLHLGNRDLEKAGDAFLRALEIREQLHVENPDDAEVCRLLANTRMNLGAVFRHRNHLTDAKEWFRKAADLQKTLADREKIPAATLRLVQRDHGMALYNYANVSLDETEFNLESDVLDPLNQAAQLFSTLLKMHPDSYSDRRRLILCRQLQAEAQSDRKAGAAAAADAAMQMRRLINENPDVPSLNDEWVQLQFLTGRILIKTGDDSGAVAAFDEILTHTERLPQSDRDTSIASAEIALCLNRMSAAESGEKLKAADDMLTQQLAESADDERLNSLWKQVRAALNAGND